MTLNSSHRAACKGLPAVTWHCLPSGTDEAGAVVKAITYLKFLQSFSRGPGIQSQEWASAGVLRGVSLSELLQSLSFSLFIPTQLPGLGSRSMGLVAFEEERLDSGTRSHVTSKSLALRVYGLVLGRSKTRPCATKASPSALGTT